MIKYLVTISLLSIYAATSLAGGLRPIVLDPSYKHDKWGTSPKDHVFKFAAFTTSFDGKDDNDDDGDPDTWGIPEWVAYEIKKVDQKHDLPDRPRWVTDKDLHEQGIAPNDSTYAVSGTRDLKIVSGDYRFVRGHMCPKDTAERVSADAAYNTHTILNAVPQLQWQNNGIWKKLEIKCEEWADKYSSVWVVCGPVFFNKQPALWLGQDGEIKAAVPDALFKIVIREDVNKAKALAFIFPNIVPKKFKDIDDFSTTIKQVEERTGLKFLNNYSDDAIKSAEGKSTDW